MTDDLEPLSTDPDARLLHMWAVENMSTSQIAKRLGVTRAVVLGRLHRLLEHTRKKSDE